MNLEKDIIRKKIEAVFAESLSKDKAAKVGFHMTDWLDDLSELLNVFESPSSADEKEFETKVLAFLAHATDHVVAANKLTSGLAITDTFKLKIFEDD